MTQTIAQGQGALGETIDRVLVSLPSSIALRRRTQLAGQTALGAIDVALYDAETPQTVANFLTYVNDTFPPTE